MSWWLWGIRCKLRNIRIFWRAVLDFNTCDYSGLLQLMEISLRAMRDLHRDHGVTVGRERTARQLTVAAELCRRLNEDRHFQNAGYDPTTWKHLDDKRKTRICEHSVQMAKNDAVYLGRAFRFVQHWWD